MMIMQPAQATPEVFEDARATAARRSSPRRSNVRRDSAEGRSGSLHRAYAADRPQSRAEPFIAEPVRDPVGKHR